MNAALGGSRLLDPIGQRLQPYNRPASFSNSLASSSPGIEAIWVLSSSIEGVACLRFGAGRLVLLQGAAAECCLKVLLSEWRLRGHAGANAKCRCKVLLESATVTVGCALEQACWYHCRVPLEGATAGCCLRVLFERVLLEGARC